MPNPPHSASKSGSDLLALAYHRAHALNGHGRSIRDWLHVSDHYRGIELVLRGGEAGEIYHIGGGTEVSSHKHTGLLLDAVGTAGTGASTWPTAQAMTCAAPRATARSASTSATPAGGLHGRPGRNGHPVLRTPVLMGAAQGEGRAGMTTS
ncbi:NAD-dependent epimerase/dehydratase family protein [Streptomyces sp. NBC_01318]|uniref:NAD-dependent epimerase/dehydratase family protein n=1 Tax=Streptomyces sp. NBC_01318 TaxID=2903823 RepID=UPI002E139211|nr:NAD-dependent epimerase/dehydratase family protein [Streptomyces sp. NBC_01318]